MYLFKSDSLRPEFNLAVEEYLVTSGKYSDHPILFLWQNENTIVVGRNQNTAAEIHQKHVALDDVTVIRRNTGGGTVFHDLGNLNYSLIYTDERDLSKDLFKETISPVIDCLNKLGVPANLRGKNDIEAAGKKISGNAMWKHKNRTLHHGTLLFNVDLEKLNSYLNIDKTKLISKNTKSVSSRVTNIKDFLPQNYKMNDFINDLINYFAELDEITWISLDHKDTTEIKNIQKNKYESEEWNFNKNSTFSYINKTRFDGKGAIEVMLNIDNNHIVEAKIYGDFLGSQGTEDLETKLINTKYAYNNISDILESVDLKNIFGELFTKEDVLNLIIE